MQAADGKARDAGPRHEKHANQMQKLLEERAKTIEDLQKREEELRATRDKVLQAHSDLLMMRESCIYCFLHC